MFRSSNMWFYPQRKYFNWKNVPYEVFCNLDENSNLFTQCNKLVKVIGNDNIELLFELCTEITRVVRRKNLQLCNFVLIVILYTSLLL